MINEFSRKMTKKIPFTKMQGAGNDYIYIDVRHEAIKDAAALAIKLSKPHFGIGSDGLVLIGNSEIGDFSMHIYNADGSEAEMCGNASRCIGKYVYEKGLTAKREILLETLSGIKILKLNVENEKVISVTVDMGEPMVGERDVTVEAKGEKFRGSKVSMGNPHFVIFTDAVEKIPLSEVGPVIEHDAKFPEGTNVEFVEINGCDEVRVRVWERGSGITMACGTGSCAVAVACVTSGRCGRKVGVTMDGGRLVVEWDAESRHVMMTGPAEFVFEGSIEVE